jgi:hypothetical protein
MLSTGTVLTEARFLGDQAERTDDIVSAQRRANPGREDQAGLLPQLADHEPVSLLLFLLLAQRLHATPRQRQGPPGFLGLGVAAFTLRAPDVDREPAFAARDGSNPALLTGCHPAGSSTQVTTWSQRSARATSVRIPTSRLSTTYECRRVPSDAASKAFACSSVKLFDGLPLRP